MRDGKKYDKSAEIFEEILQNIPVNELILFNYGALLYEQKRYKKMEEVLRKLLTINPDNSQALNFLGYFLVDKGKKENLEEGYKLISKALSFKPSEITYQDSLAWYYFRVGTYVEANKILNSFNKVQD